MYERILVALDGSQESAGILELARTLAKAGGAQIELLRVLPSLAQFIREVTFSSSAVDDMDASGVYQTSLPEWEGLHADLKERAAVQMETLAASLRDGGVAATAKVAEGDAAEAIVDEASAVPDTLVAMATHGRSGIGRWLMGSVTDRVLRSSETPVLVIRPGEAVAGARPVAIRRVVLPLDGSILAEQAMPHAVAMARMLGADLRVVRAVVPLAYVLPEMVEYRKSERLQGAHEYVDWACRQLRQAGAQQVESSVVEGDAATFIEEAAGQQGDALVVMSTHGRSGVRRWLLGSVADKVVRQSHAPVLLVRAQEMG